MGFIGVQPASVPLTASDITDGIISKSKIANDAVDNTKLDLTDDYAFTGTVSGAGGGKVGQIISAVTTTSTNIASTSYADTTVTSSITPTATNSKVLVMVSIHVALDRDENTGHCALKLLRDSTNIWESGNYIAWIEAGSVNAVKSSDQASIVYLDSPSSTSALTYKVQGHVSHTGNNGQARFQVASNPSSITLMEILA